MASSLAALTYRNFRLLWLGTFVSMAGSIMRNAAILWHLCSAARNQATRSGAVRRGSRAWQAHSRRPGAAL